MAQSAEYPDAVWMGPPRAYGTGRDGKAVRLSVVHYTAGNAGPGNARSGAAYDKTRTDGTSCHCFHDSAESAQEVLTRDRSNSAFSKGNRIGVHHELCATLKPRSWWLTGVGLATLTRGARASAWDCRTFGLEPRRLTVAEVRAAWYSYPNGPRGLCGHVDITKAFPEDGGTHTDPGPEFPWDVYETKVREFLGGAATASASGSSSEEFLMGLSQKTQDDLAFTTLGAPNGPSHVRDGRLEGKVDALATAVAELKARPAATVELTPESLSALSPVIEAAVRNVLGSLDATPPVP